MLKASSKASSCGGLGGVRSPQAVSQFDFGAVDRDRVVMDEEDATREKLLRVLNAVCEWLYPPRVREGTMLLRMYAFVWFLRPEWLGNPTQVELAERLKVSKQQLGKVVNKLRNTFGFYVAGMRGEAAREKFRVNAKVHADSLAAARRQAAGRKKGAEA